MSDTLEVVYKKFKRLDLINAEYKRRALSQRVDASISCLLWMLYALLCSSVQLKWNRLAITKFISLSYRSFIDAGKKCKNAFFILVGPILCFKLSSLSSGLLEVTPMVFLKIKGENNAEYSAVKIENYNHMMSRFDKGIEIPLGEREYFGVVMQRNKIFVLGGEKNDKALKSVSFVANSKAHFM